MVSDVHFMSDCGALFPSAAAPLGRFLKRDKYSGSPRETRFTTFAHAPKPKKMRNSV